MRNSEVNEMESVKYDKCLRCNAEMKSYGKKTIQFGQFGLIAGGMNNYIEGGIEVDIYTCIECGKVEFYTPLKPEEKLQEPTNSRGEKLCQSGYCKID